MSVDGYNLFLIIVTVVAALLIAAVTLYLLVAFSHPEDRNQAWIPKIVVCLSLFVAISTVLLFPLDVANRRACDDRLLFDDCDLTMPMKELWTAAYIANIVLVYLVTPFTLFYYEADSDLTLFQRLRSALFFTFLAAIVFVLVFGIIYGVGGYVEYDVTLLSSGTVPVSQLGALTSCISTVNDAITADPLCSAFDPNVVTALWKERTTYIVYIIAVASILGWLLLMVMGGVGIVALPLDMIWTWFGRPKKTISKSQYVEGARKIGERAKDLHAAAKDLRNKELDGKEKRRTVRRQTKALQKELVALEEDGEQLEKMYPQGENRDTTWILYVLGFWASLFGGIVFLVVGVAWIVHIVIYVIISPPLHPFLNDFFRELDDAFVLLGVAFFALFCYYLIIAAIKGFTKLGLNFVFIQLYPMRLGATLMNSFLVNTALILLASTAVVQFCAQAFAAYAQQTYIQEIFGTEIFNLSGVKYLFTDNIFIYIMLGFAALTSVWIAIRGPQKRKKLTIEEIYAL